MNVPQSELDAIAAQTLRLRALVQQASRKTGQVQFDALMEADTLFAVLVTRLKAAGATDPRAPRVNGEGAAPAASASDVPLALLDTPANRRYADTLRAAWEAGLAVDRERYGETIGTDGCAQVIEMVLADVEAELHGPAGSGE